MLVTFSPKARRDLVEIARYTATDSPQQAEKFTAKLVAACETLEDYPERYPVLQRYAQQAYRRRPFEQYSIIYTVLVEEVQIVRVLSAWVDIETAL